MKWFTPIDERIEEAAKRHATLTCDAEYHRLLAAYYLAERHKVNPASSVAGAYRFATMFEKYEDQLLEEKRALEKANDAEGKLNALIGSQRQ